MLNEVKQRQNATIDQFGEKMKTIGRNANNLAQFKTWVKEEAKPKINGLSAMLERIADKLYNTAKAVVNFITQAATSIGNFVRDRATEVSNFF